MAAPNRVNFRKIPNGHLHLQSFYINLNLEFTKRLPATKVEKQLSVFFSSFGQNNFLLRGRGEVPPNWAKDKFHQKHILLL